MATLLLQDIRKKAIKQAYIQAVLDASKHTILENSAYDVDVRNINEVSNYVLVEMFTNQANDEHNKKRIPNIYDRAVDWLRGLPLDNDYETYTICKWLEDNNLVESDFISKADEKQMQQADDRHWYYLAKTILDNADKRCFYKLV